MYKPSSNVFCWIYAFFLFLEGALGVCANNSQLKESFYFQIHPTDALEGISLFAEITKVPLVYNVKDLDGVLLNPISGRMRPRKAMLNMIEGTSLILDEEKVPGIWILRKADTDVRDIAKELQFKNTDERSLRLESIFELSPFVIESDDSIGYTSTSSLAGTRIKANLKDIAAFLQVATPEFLEDTQATDLPSLGAYIANLEANPVNPYDFRIRGMLSATQTRDYFLTNMAFDSYNIERITLNSGANSILSGLGDPAGIINAGLKKAYLGGNRKSLQFRYGSHDAWRAVLDLEHTIIEDKFALRVIGLSEDHKNQWEGASYRDERLFLAATYKIFDRTFFRGNYEKVRFHGRPEFRYSLIDGFSGWIDAGTPVYDPSTNDPIPDGLVLPRLTGGLNQLVVYDSPTSNNISTMMLSSNLAGNPRNDPMVSTIGRFQSEPNWFGQTIIDESVFDFKSKSANINDGTFDTQTSDIYSASIEHAIGDSFRLEFAVFHENYDEQTAGFFPDELFQYYPGTVTVNIDANIRLQDGSANPNFLRPYTDINTGFEGYETKSNDELRLTSAYQIDFSDYGSHLSWLGNHKLTGVYSKKKYEEKSIAFHPLAYISTELSDRIGGGFAIDGYQAFSSRVYLGDAVSLENPLPQGMLAPSFGLSVPESLNFKVLNDFTGHFEEYEIPVREFASGRENTLTHIDSFVLGLHSFFVNDRLVTTVGYRKDTIDVDVASDLPDIASDLISGSDYWGSREDHVPLGDLETYTFGGVFYAFPWLRFHYNSSKNFRPDEIGAEKVNIWGDAIDRDYGVSVDYGFSLTLLEEKLDIQFNWFEIRRRNVNDDEVVELGLLPVFQWFESDLLEQHVIPAGRSDEWVFHSGFVDSSIDPSVVGDIIGYTAEGMEISAVYNPSANWRILFNVGHQKTVQSDRGVFIQEWLDLRWSNYEQFFDLPSPRPNVAGPTLEEWSKYILEPITELIATEGRTSAHQREWRFNIVTNYDFNEGPLKGIGIGGAYRWEDSPIIGYAWSDNNDIGTSYFSDIATDTNNPQKGSVQTNTDLWVRYKRAFWGGKLSWSIQLNVRNVFNNDDPVAVVADSYGNPIGYTFPESRRWFITNTLSF